MERGDASWLSCNFENHKKTAHDKGKSSYTENQVNFLLITSYGALDMEEDSSPRTEVKPVQSIDQQQLHLICISSR